MLLAAVEAVEMVVLNLLQESLANLILSQNLELKELLLMTRQ